MIRFKTKTLKQIWHRTIGWARRLPRAAWIGVGVSVAALTITLVSLATVNARYNLSAAQQKLLTKPGVATTELKYKNGAFTYNTAEDVADDTVRKLVAANNASDSTPDIPYGVSLAEDPAKGVTFGDANGELSFTMIPNNPGMTGRMRDGRVIYPTLLGGKNVYTFKRNGIKEDIILDRAPAKVARYSWSLNLGDKLEARELPNGGIGIYSANPYLFGNLQVSDEKSQGLVDNARHKGPKNNLVFILPAPVIVDSKGNKNIEDVSYMLEGSTLTLEARNLYNKAYPISIDPTVAVSSSDEFRVGLDDGMIDYTSDQISRVAVTLGSTGAFSSEDSLTTARSAHATVAYHGYMYVIGGLDGSSNVLNSIEYAAISGGTIGSWTTDTGGNFTTARQQLSAVAYNGYLYVIGGVDGSSNVLSDVQYASLDPSDGSVGAWASASSFSIARKGHTSVAYNGYLYVTGGEQGDSDGDCKDSGSNAYCNDTQYAAINPDGTLGSFTTDSNSYFSYPRAYHASVAYNGRLYITGGFQANSDTSCIDSGSATQYCNDLQYAVINTDGSLQTWIRNRESVSLVDYFFNFPRKNLAAAAYGGFFYISGGEIESSSTDCKPGGDSASAFCRDVQYAAINADGSVGITGDWTTSNDYFSTVRTDHTSAIYNGYIYIIGGADSSSTELSDTKVAQIDTGSPTFGSETAFSGTPQYFSKWRNGHASVAYNGYLYVIGGQIDSSSSDCKDSGTSVYCNDIQYAPINTDGSVGTFVPNDDLLYTRFSTPRTALSVVVYNDYLYVIGGLQGTNNACENDAASLPTCNDVQYAHINSDGSIDDFTAAGNFTNPRYYLGATAYNGYLYISGGHLQSSGTVCKGAGSPPSTLFCSDTQYSKINSGGSLSAPSNCAGSGGTLNGVWCTDSDNFAVPRSEHTLLAYNGYLYVVAGTQTAADGLCEEFANPVNVCNDIQRTVIDSSDGSIGDWADNSTDYFITARRGAGVFAYNGYIYVAGGFESTNDFACKDGAQSRYCNDVQHALISTSDGSVGTFSSISDPPEDGYFLYDRANFGFAVYNGYLYITGGFIPNVGNTCKDDAFSSSQRCNDVRHGYIASPANQAVYERAFSVGDTGTNIKLNSIDFNGQAVCGAKVSYRTATTGGSYGSTTTATIPIATAGATTITLNQSNKQFLWVRVVLNDQNCGTNSYITDITLNWQYDPPDAPTLNSPADGAFNQSLTPSFQFRSPQANNSYLRYMVQVCTVSDCTSGVVGTFCQETYSGTPPPPTCTASQTGWTGQDQQSNTAYTGNANITSSTMATYTWQSSLSYNQHYYWRAWAIDPAKSNTWSAASSIRSFYTNYSPTVPTLVSPANNSAGVNVTPDFRLYSTDQDSDYIRYYIEVCSDSLCNSVLIRPICQQTYSGTPPPPACTGSQTGWQGQTAQSGTAYNSGDEASHLYQLPALGVSTQYWWRAYAIDPGGVGVLTSASAIYTFTTSTSAFAGVNIMGGTNLMGGTSF